MISLMRALVQKVAWAEVDCAAGSETLSENVRPSGRIGEGILVYVGIASDDTVEEAKWLANKVSNLRIFPDEQGKLNKSIQDVRGDVLIVSNFTLLADATSGRRPSFSAAATFEQAKPIYQFFVDILREQGLNVQTGVFGAMMEVRSQASGPVNIIIDSPRRD